MKVVGLLPWYDEPTRLLWKCVRSLEGVVDHLIAFDGAYALFPRGKPRSPSSQPNEIRWAAEEAGIKLDIYTPETVWQGNEVEKRTFMFRYGEQFTTEEDWFFVIDADEHVTSVGSFRSGVLAHTTYDVAAVDLDGTAYRQLYRALRGIYVDGAHYVYKHGDRYLWGNQMYHQFEPCADARMLKLAHTPWDRPKNREERKSEYYRVRHATQAEWVNVRGGQVWPA